MENMQAQAVSFGARIEDYKPPVKINLQGDTKCLQTQEVEYCARAVIITSGARARKLPAEGADRLLSRGVHYCATCDGPFYKDKKIMVVGGGNSAVTEAVFLTRFASEVIMVNKADKFQAEKTILEEALKNPKIKVLPNSQITMVQGDTHVTSVKLKDMKTNQESEINTDAVFVFIGNEPKSEMFKGQLKVTEAGYILTDAEMRTEIPGVFCAGDVREKSVRQAITAAGDGAVAAIQAEKYLAGKMVGGMV